MSRVNCVPGYWLTDQALLREYNSLHFVASRARLPTKWETFPAVYTAGEGHMQMFFLHTSYLSVRADVLLEEIQSRGLTVKHTYKIYPKPGLEGSWSPTQEDRKLNVKLLTEEATIRKVVEYKRETMQADEYIKILNKLAKRGGLREVHHRM